MDNCSTIRINKADRAVFNKYASLLGWSMPTLLHFIADKMIVQCPEIRKKSVERLREMYELDEIIRGEKNG